MTADNVNHPSHYNMSAVFETIVIIDELCAAYPGAEAFSVGCTIKYISRAPHKGSKLEDLRKAAWYLRHAIELVEKALQREAGA